MGSLVQDYWDEYRRTGEFGLIRLGMSREQVRAILGEPEQVGGTWRKYRKPSIWKYGDVEFFFSLGGGALCSIYAEDAEGECVLYIGQGPVIFGEPECEAPGREATQSRGRLKEPHPSPEP